jgi:hypothetical protein
MKRVCIKELPRTLILHLKRFEFDLDFMKKVKVNDCCEFPTRLDMYPYTLAGIEEREKAVTEAVRERPLFPFPFAAIDGCISSGFAILNGYLADSAPIKCSLVSPRLLTLQFCLHRISVFCGSEWS